MYAFARAAASTGRTIRPRIVHPSENTRYPALSQVANDVARLRMMVLEEDVANPVFAQCPGGAFQGCALEALDVQLQHRHRRRLQHIVERLDTNQEGIARRRECRRAEPGDAVVAGERLRNIEDRGARRVGERRLPEVDLGDVELVPCAVDVSRQDFEERRMRLERDNPAGGTGRERREQGGVPDVCAGIDDRIARRDQARQRFRQRDVVDAGRRNTDGRWIGRDQQ